MVKLKARAGPGKNAPRMKRTQKEHAILELLNRSKNLNGTEIAKRLKKDTGNTYAILHDMEERKLIKSKRTKDRGDKARSCQRSRTYEINKDHPRNKKITKTKTTGSDDLGGSFHILQILYFFFIISSNSSFSIVSSLISLSAIKSSFSRLVERTSTAVLRASSINLKTSPSISEAIFSE